MGHDGTRPKPRFLVHDFRMKSAVSISPFMRNPPGPSDHLHRFLSGSDQIVICSISGSGAACPVLVRMTLSFSRLRSGQARTIPSLLAIRTASRVWLSSAGRTAKRFSLPELLILSMISRTLIPHRSLFPHISGNIENRYRSKSMTWDFLLYMKHSHFILFFSKKCHRHAAPKDGTSQFNPTKNCLRAENARAKTAIALNHFL